jgi:hypothetical protein
MCAVHLQAAQIDQVILDLPRNLYSERELNLLESQNTVL